MCFCYRDKEKERESSRCNSSKGKRNGLQEFTQLFFYRQTSEEDKTVTQPTNRVEDYNIILAYNFFVDEYHHIFNVCVCVFKCVCYGEST